MGDGYLKCVLGWQLNSMNSSNSRTQFENAFEKLRTLGLLNDQFKELAHLSQFHGEALEQESIWL